jgi:hypothetical protein
LTVILVLLKNAYHRRDTYFPEICYSTEIKDWFSNGKLEEIKNTLSHKCELFWVGTKKVEGKFNMIFIVSMHGEVHWSLINGVITKNRQLHFMMQARKKMKPIQPILLRTKKGNFEFNDKYRYPPVYRARPSPDEIAAIPQRRPARLDLHGLCRSG